MRELKINITKAKISTFGVELRDDEPKVAVTIDLLTENGQKITSYTIGTHSYYNENSKFQLPMTLIEPIKNIMNQLEQIVVAHCASQQKILGE